jgi:diguanylate cyclase (GGDEF)-like protein
VLGRVPRSWMCVAYARAWTFNHRIQAQSQKAATAAPAIPRRRTRRPREGVLPTETGSAGREGRLSQPGASLPCTGMTGVVRTSAWDLAVESVEEALADGVLPSLERLGRLGQLGTLPSFVASLDGDQDPGELAEDHTRERESLGLAPAEVAAELLVLGRVLDRHGEREARRALDRCVVAYVERVTGELAERARRDPLTGVLNHRAFHARLLAEAARARRYRSRIALLLFDLDRFKETNDREGHQEGDRLLRAFAAALAGTARETDSVGRLGGDEFAALLIEAGPETAGSFLHRLHERLPEGVSASAGAAFLPTDSSEPEGLVEVADRRLYEDKRASSRAA